jgi:hypothetical protein
MNKKLQKVLKDRAKSLAQSYADKGRDDAAEAGAKAVGNWLKFDSFMLFDSPDPKRFTIVYTNHRDSGILANVNAKVTDDVMDCYKRDCTKVSHSHWAVGHINGYEIKVFKKDGSVTEAWCAYCGIINAMESYPVLDDEAYSNAETESVLKSIRWEGKSLIKPDTADGWEGDVYSWLSDNDPSAVECVDDQGGYVDSDRIKPALKELGMLHEAYDDEEEADAE